MNAIASFGAFGTIFTAGFGLLCLLAWRPSRLNLPEQFALSWLLGTGAVSLLLWIFGLFLRGPFLVGAVALFCVVLPFVAWKANGRNAFHGRFSRALRPIELLLAIILLFQVLGIFYLASVHTLGWDGLFNWEIKARYAFANGGALPAAYFRDGGRSFTHPGYPLAIPFTELWIYFWLGEANQFWAKMVFPMFYLAGAMLVAGISARMTGKLWPGLGAATLLFFIPQVATDAFGSAIVGYADFPLSVFYLGTIGYLLLACEDGEDDSFRIFTACLFLLPWVKRDGVILWMVAAFCGILLIWRRKRSPAFLLALVPGLVLMAGWRLYLSRMEAISSPEFLPLSFSSFRAHLDRIGPLICIFASELLNSSRWGLFWLLVAIAVAYLGWRYRDLSGITLLLGMVAPLVIYPFIYVFTAWPNYVQHVSLSVGRLFLHVAPLSLLAVCLASASRSLQPMRSRKPAASGACKNVEPERTPEIEFV